MLTQEEEGKEFGEKREGGRTKFLQFGLPNFKICIRQHPLHKIQALSISRRWKNLRNKK
jgi:hypothetical protein